MICRGTVRRNPCSRKCPSISKRLPRPLPPRPNPAFGPHPGPLQPRPRFTIFPSNSFLIENHFQLKYTAEEKLCQGIQKKNRFEPYSPIGTPEPSKPAGAKQTGRGLANRVEPSKPSGAKRT